MVLARRSLRRFAARGRAALRAPAPRGGGSSRARALPGGVAVDVRTYALRGVLAHVHARYVHARTTAAAGAGAPLHEDLARGAARLARVGGASRRAVRAATAAPPVAERRRRPEQRLLGRIVIVGRVGRALGTSTRGVGDTIVVFGRAHARQGGRASRRCSAGAESMSASSGSSGWRRLTGTRARMPAAARGSAAFRLQAIGEARRACRRPAPRARRRPADRPARCARPWTPTPRLGRGAEQIAFDARPARGTARPRRTASLPCRRSRVSSSSTGTRTSWTMRSRHSLLIAATASRSGRPQSSITCTNVRTPSNSRRIRFTSSGMSASRSASSR